MSKEKTWIEESYQKERLAKALKASNPKPVKTYTRDQNGFIRDEHGVIFQLPADQKEKPAEDLFPEGVFQYHDDSFEYKHSKIMTEARVRLGKVLREHPGDRNSLHEAWGLIREEFLELEDELRKKTPRYRDIADEAYDVMITCARLIAFCNDKLPQEFLPDLKNKDGQYPGHEDKF